MLKFSQLVSLSLVYYFSKQLFTRVAKATLIRSKSLIRSINPNWTIMLATFQRFHPVQGVQLQHILLLDKQYLIHCLIFQKVKLIINVDITSMQGESILIILNQILIRFLSLFRSKPCIKKVIKTSKCNQVLERLFAMVVRQISILLLPKLSLS